MHNISVHPDVHDLHPQEDLIAEEPQKAVNYGVAMFILVLVTAAFHQMAFGAILPIYLLDSPSYNSTSLDTATAFKPHLDLTGGMGFSLHDVGAYLAVNGFIALFIQGVIFPVFVEKAGVWLSFLLPTLIYPACYIVMPLLSLLRTGTATPTDESWLLPAGIYTTMFFQNIFGIIATPCALILLKNACPSPLVLGRVNGLAMSAVCAARTVSSPLVGVVYDAGGSAAAWGFCAVVAAVGALQLLWVPREAAGSAEGEAEVHVENVLVGHSHHAVAVEAAVEDDEDGEETGLGK